MVKIVSFFDKWKFSIGPSSTRIPIALGFDALALKLQF
jgi:hypothetical protein